MGQSEYLWCPPRRSSMENVAITNDVRAAPRQALTQPGSRNYAGWRIACTLEWAGWENGGFLYRTTTKRRSQPSTASGRKRTNSLAGTTKSSRDCAATID